MVDYLPVTCQNGNHKEKKEKYPLCAPQAFTNRGISNQLQPLLPSAISKVTKFFMYCIFSFRLNCRIQIFGAFLFIVIFL